MKAVDAVIFMACVAVIGLFAYSCIKDKPTYQPGEYVWPTPAARMPEAMIKPRVKDLGNGKTAACSVVAIVVTYNHTILLNPDAELWLTVNDIPISERGCFVELRRSEDGRWFGVLHGPHKWQPMLACEEPPKGFLPMSDFSKGKDPPAWWKKEITAIPDAFRKKMADFNP